MRTPILFLVLSALPATAMAQVCPYGLVAVDAAHCCWPGQSFDPARGVCAGVPQCPAGLAPHGETCLATAGAAQPQPQADPAAQALPPPPPPPANYQPMPAQQLPPQAFGYPVRFQAKKEGHEFTVSIDNGVSCRTPCELTVAPGRHKVVVEGDAHFDERMVFPASPSTVVIERRGGIAALGKASLGVGIPAVAVGLVVSLVGYVNAEITDPFTSLKNTNKTFRDMEYVGIGVAVGGAVLLGVGCGVGFGMAGKNRVSFARGEVSESEAPVQLIGMSVAPTNGGAMAGAAFAF